jgi:H+/Cl- antiporter ClcA
LPSTIAVSTLGAVFGGSVAALLVIGFTEMLKAMLAVVSRQHVWALILVPLLGLALSVLVLYRLGLSSEEQGSRRPKWAKWRTFPPGAARSHLTDDMVSCAGCEERFAWHLAPIRLLAICATVGFGCAMGTEAPAAYMGVATGAALGTRWRRILRPAAVGGGAAGVSALMGIPLVGTAYILELGRRHKAPLNVERVTAALVGGFVGWLLNISLGVTLIRLVVPKESPHNFYQALVTALVIGGLSGSITSLSGAAIYRAKAWKASPIIRLVLGGLALGVAAVMISIIASPEAAIGPGGGAILWVESATGTAALTVLAVDVLRAVATTATAAAGGCGGVFVPFLAIGDLAGRAFAPSLEISSDLAGAAGAAGGISGGYHLPFTAVALVLSQGGPPLAVLTCLATVIVAAFAGTGSAKMLDRILSLGRRGVAEEPTMAEDPYSF